MTTPATSRANGLALGTWLTTLMATGVLATAAPEPPPPSTAASAAAGVNVYLAGGDVQPSGDVAGDFIAVGGRVIVDRAVRGDVAVAGGAVDIRAPVGDDLRAVGGDVRIAATVAGEAIATGGSVLLAGGARIGHHATLNGGSVRVEGSIDGPLTARAHRVSIGGVVAGDADLSAETIELGPGARIGGALRYASPNDIVRAEGAVVTGPISRVADADRGREQRTGGPRLRRADSSGWEDGPARGGWVGAVLGFAAVLASGALVLLVFPRFAADASQVLRTSPGRALLLGAAALLALPLLALLLCITLLGIPLGIALLALYPPLLLLGYVVGVHFIAARSQAALRPAETTASVARTIGFFALALLLLTLLGRLPVVGGVVMVIVAVLGVGAGLLALQQRRQGGKDAGGAAAS